MGVCQIAAQIIGIFAFLFLVISYYQEDLKKLLIFQISSSFMFCLNYALVGAWSGLFISIFELSIGFLHFKSDKDKLIYYLSLPVYVIIAYFTIDFSVFNTTLIIGLVGILASIVDGFGITKSKNAVIVGSIISYIMWCIYDFYYGSYSVAFTDTLLVISNIRLLLVGYSRLLRVDKFHIVKCSYLSRNVLSNIDSLDKNNYTEDLIWNGKYQTDVFNKNSDSLLLIKYKKKIVGYINYLVISEDLYDDILHSKKIINEYNVDDIVKFKTKRKNYLLIESVSVDKKYQNYKTSKLIKSKLKSLIRQKYHQGYNISSIISNAVYSFEDEFLKEAGFNKIREFDDKKSLYLLTKEGINEFYLTKDFKEKEKNKDYKIIKKNISDDILYEIGTLDSVFFSKKYLWTYPQQKGIYMKNPNSLVCITYKGKLIGYVNYLCISEDKYNYIKKSDDIVDDFQMGDICKYRKTYKNYVVIDSVVIDENFQNGETIRMINKELKRELKKLHKSGYKIYGITSTAISKDGKKFLDQNDFECIKKLNSNNYLYVLENESLKDYLK